MTFKGSYKKGGLKTILIVQNEWDWDRARGKGFQWERRVGTGVCCAVFGNSLWSPCCCMLGETLLPSSYGFACLGWAFTKLLLLSRNPCSRFPRAGEVTYRSGVWRKELGMSSSAHHFLQNACILPCPLTLRDLQIYGSRRSREACGGGSWACDWVA